jgi:hypothetical protein
MPQPKFQLYKHININSKWCYCRAAIYSNGKIKPHVIVVSGQVREARRRLLLHPPQEVLDWGGLPTLMLELGRESLATMRDYLADVRREDEAKKAVADADFVPKPRLVSGTDGD